MISAIVATAKNNVIGKNNALPWSLPAELKHFKEVTMGRPILMGRKTYESIGRILPGRTNIIVSRNSNYKAEGAIVVSSIDEALNAVANEEEVFIIGGEAIYNEAMPKIQRLYKTEVKAEIEGDRFFHYTPDEWKEISREEHKKDPANPYDYDFIVLERKE
jgi:dihydrofolate reductase